MVEDFESDSLGQLPFNCSEQKMLTGLTFILRKLKLFLPNYRGRTSKDEVNKFLFHGVIAKHLNFPLHQVTNLNLNDTPILS